MEDRPSNASFIIAIVVLLVAVGFLISLRSPTGSFLGITPCYDSDGGERPFAYGYARDLSTATKFDVCKDEQTVNEAYCEDGVYSRYKAIGCPKGKACRNGICAP